MDKAWLIDDKYFCYDSYDFFVDNGMISDEAALRMFTIYRFSKYHYTDCPFCGLENINYSLRNGVYKCKICGGKFSLTAGTFIENHKIPLSSIFRLCYLIGDLKITNSCSIAKDLKITQRSAWLLIDNIRQVRKIASTYTFKNGKEALVFEKKEDIIKLLLLKKQTHGINK